MQKKKKLILISGPSCVGKGPLLAALKKFHPELEFGEIPVIRSHGSRDGKPRNPQEAALWHDPGYFMPGADFKGLDPDRYVVGDCRGFPQAIDLERFAASESELMLMEVYHTIGAQFKSRTFKALKGTETHSVFVSPVSQEELDMLDGLGISTDGYIFNLMLNKQIRRSLFWQRNAARELENLVSRAKDAPNEIRNMKNYDSVIVCREGEGSPLWNQNRNGTFSGKPRYDAAQALEALVSIIKS